MKKTLSILLIVLLCIGISACGETSQPASSNTAPPPQSNITLPNQTPTEQPSGSAPDAPQSSAPTDEKPYGGILKMITTNDTSYPFGLPWKSGANNSTQVIVPFGECLVLESTAGDIHPWLATDLEIDVEKAEVRLNLRDDVYFSDGSKLTAEVVSWNFAKAREAGILNPAVDRVEVRGDYAVASVMVGGEFVNYIPNGQASHSFAMISKENFDKNGEDYAGEHPVGTGPFIMTEKNPGVSVKYARNPNYWQEGKPYLDGFEFHAITDVMTQNAAMLTSGSDRIDVLNASGNAEQWSVLGSDPNLTVYAFTNGVTAIYPSSRNEDSPFANLEVRQAVSYAIDRQTIADAKGFGYLGPATQYIANGYYGYFPDGRNMFSYDPAKAKELLSAAGYPNGFNTVWHVNNNVDKDITLAITDMLADIGIICELDFCETARLSELRATGWEGMIYMAFTSLASLPSTFRLQVDPYYAFNVSTWRPPDYEQDFINLRQSPTFDQGLAQIAHQWIADYMVVVPVMQQASTYIVRNNVKDGEFGYWAVGTQWLPSNIWIEP